MAQSGQQVINNLKNVCKCSVYDDSEIKRRLAALEAKPNLDENNIIQKAIQAFLKHPEFIGLVGAVSLIKGDLINSLADVRLIKKMAENAAETAKAAYANVAKLEKLFNKIDSAADVASEALREARAANKRAGDAMGKAGDALGKAGEAGEKAGDALGKANKLSGLLPLLAIVGAIVTFFAAGWSVFQLLELMGEVHTLEGAVQQIFGMIAAHSQHLGRHDGQIKNLEAVNSSQDIKINNLEFAITGINAKIKSLNEAVSVALSQSLKAINQSNIAVQKATLAISEAQSAKDKVSALSKKIEALQSKIKSIELAISNLIKADIIINARIDKLKLSGITPEIQREINQLKSVDTAIKNQIRNLQNEENKLATDISALGIRINQIKGKPGAPGTPGSPGKDGKDGITKTITQVITLPGTPGSPGKDGKDGKDGITKTITQVITLPGTPGTPGKNGKDGKNVDANELTKIRTDLIRIDKVNQEANNKLDNFISKLPGMIAISLVGLTPAIQNAVKTATPPFVCNALPVANTVINPNTNRSVGVVGTALNAMNTAYIIPMSGRVGAILNGVNAIGNTISTGFTKTWNFLKLDRILNLLTFAATIHNAAMLSVNLVQTLGQTISNVLAAVGLKDANNTAFNFQEIIGKEIDYFIKGIIGFEQTETFKTTFTKLNVIINSASNILFSLQSIGQSILGALELVGSHTANIGNALKKARVIMENSFAWMNPTPNFQNRFFTVINDTQQVVSQVDMIASTILSTQEQIKQIGDQMNDLNKSAKELPGSKQGEGHPEATKTKAAADAAKLHSKSPEISSENLINPDL